MKTSTLVINLYNVINGLDNACCPFHSNKGFRSGKVIGHETDENYFHSVTPPGTLELGCSFQWERYEE